MPLVAAVNIYLCVVRKAACNKLCFPYGILSLIFNDIKLLRVNVTIRKRNGLV
jgi:hypothetical protein